VPRGGAFTIALASAGDDPPRKHADDQQFALRVEGASPFAWATEGVAETYPSDLWQRPDADPVAAA
jgi:hypothetical protein